jgi:hypothetical protein
VNIETSEKTEEVDIRCSCGCSKGIQTITEFVAGGLPIKLEKSRCTRCDAWATHIYVDGTHSGTVGKSGKWIPREDLEEENIRKIKRITDTVYGGQKDAPVTINEYGDPVLGPVELFVKFIIGASHSAELIDEDLLKR